MTFPINETRALAINEVASPLTQNTSLIHQASVTLDNDQILHLPTTAVEIVPASGATRIVLPTLGLWLSNFSDAYADVSNASWSLLLGGSEISAPVYASGVLATGASRLGEFLLIQSSEGTGDFAGIQVTQSLTGVTPESMANLALTIKDSYDGVPDYTLGHADNTLIVAVEFRVFDRALNKFLTVSESGWNESTRQFYLPAYPQPE